MSEQNPGAHTDIRGFQPVPWHLIPDLGLYMDQVITFIGRIYRPVYGEDMKRYLSPSMINNYVKGRLIPRPTGKKYGREQIALLTMIVALKQVSSMDEIRQMLAPLEGESVESLYSAFCTRYSRVVQTLCPDGAAASDGLDAALEYAIMASGYQAGCTALLRAREESVDGAARSG